MTQAIRAAIVVAFVLVGLAPLSAQTTEYPLQQQGPPGGFIYSAADTNIGWLFTCKAKGVQVTQLGCVTYDGNPRVITIFENSTHNIVAQATTAGSGNFAWRWATLPEPVMLKKDEQYVITQFTGSYNYFIDVNVNTYSSWKPTGNIEFMRSLIGTGTASTFPGSNYGSAQIYGIPDFAYQLVPALEVTATPGTSQPVFPADQGPLDNGVVAGKFTITSVGQPQIAKLDTITIRASGTGNDAAAFTSVSIFRDSNSNGVFDAGTDTQIGQTASSFSGDDGSVTFTAQTGEQAFASGESRDYFLVVKLSGQSQFGETFQFKVFTITTLAPTGKTGTPSALMEGLHTTHAPFNLTDFSPAVQNVLARDTAEYVIQEFIIHYSAGPDRIVTRLIFEASGTGDDAADLVSVSLYRDADQSGSYDSGQDLLLGTFPGFPVDDGVLTFILPGTEPVFKTADTRRYFLVVVMDYRAADGASYHTQLLSGVEQTANIGFVPSPLPAAGPTPGLVCQNHNLVCTLNGPSTPTLVPNNSLGPERRGHVICDVSVQAFGKSWTVDHLDFRASGTGNDLTAYSSLLLVEDYNDSGAYEGLPQDIDASIGVGISSFPSDDGLLSIPLFDTVMPVNTNRRFFLVATLVGSATTGQTFNAALEGWQGSAPPALGLFIASETSLGLTIDVPTVFAGIGSGSAGDSSHESGEDFDYVLAKFRFSASGAPATLYGLTLTTYGNANWSSDLHGGDGLQLWLDDGDGIFDDTVDSMLCAVNGAAPLIFCSFNTTVEVPTSGSRDIWVRLLIQATAGSGVPVTFQLSIDNEADVDAGLANVLFAAMEPVSGKLSVVHFVVDSFDPQTAPPEGGTPILIKGSGFVLPVKVTIGSKVCTGTAAVSPTGTQITGLYVPQGSGKQLPILLKTGGLPEKTLPMQFSYNGGSSIDDFDHTSTCSVAPGAGHAWLALPLVLVALLALRRRKTAAR